MNKLLNLLNELDETSTEELLRSCEQIQEDIKEGKLSQEEIAEQIKAYEKLANEAERLAIAIAVAEENNTAQLQALQKQAQEDYGCQTLEQLRETYAQHSKEKAEAEALTLALGQKLQEVMEQAQKSHNNMKTLLQ